MYRIGEFSKITDISVKTLRYYNEIGLLIPEEVDIYTGYRYYGDRNLNELKIISNLKKSGFTLEEIINNWNNFDYDILEKKKEQLYKEKEELDEAIRKIDYLKGRLVDGHFEDQERESIKIMKRGNV